MKNLFTVLFIALFFALNANGQNKNFATLKVKINNTQVDSLVLVSFKNPNFKKIIYADEYGIFKDTMNVKSEKYYVSNLSNLFPNGIYLNNGYDLKVSVDSKAPSKSLQFSGKGGIENDFVTTFAKNEENFDYESILQYNEKTFEEEIYKIRLNLFNTLDKKKYSSDFVVYQTEYLDYFINMKKETYKTIVAVRASN